MLVPHVSLAQAAQIRGGISSSREKGERDAWFILARHLTPGTLDPHQFDGGPQPERAADTSRVTPDDVLLALRGTENVAVLVREQDLPEEPVFTSAEVGTIRPDPSRLLPSYLTAWLNLPSSQHTLREDRAGTTTARLSLKALGALPVPLPPLERQRAFAALAEAAAEERAILETIRDARQRVLHELLRRVAEEPVPGSSPARDRKRSEGPATADRASSNPSDELEYLE